VLVELLTGVLGLAVAERFFVRAAPGTGFLQAGLETLLYFAFVGGLVIATFVDLEWMEIPDEVSLPGAALGLATVGLRTSPGALEAAVGAGLGFLIIQLLFVWAYELLTGRRGMGEGDAKLLLMIGAFLGWQSVLFVLVAGSMQGLLAAGLATLWGVPLVPKRPDEEPNLVAAPGTGVPPATDGTPASTSAPEVHGSESGPPMMVFGPMLALSAIEYLFFGEEIVARVANWFAA
jgi:leader peptidase (prepilin peptidase)/N-methyltransferase